MTVTISKELTKFVDAAVKQGQFPSPAMAVEEGLKLLQKKSQRLQLSREIEEYVDRNAGSDEDLDESLEAAGIECLESDA